jgi:hypothetical protein
LVLLSACASREPPRLEPLLRLEPKTPVVVVPGFTGSKLLDPATGKLIWGSAARVFFPRDGGYSMALPLDAKQRAQQALKAVDVVRRLRAGFVKIDIYGGLIELLEANGYRLGDLDDPRAEDTLFFFPYDWRYNNVSAAADLTAKLVRLRAVRGESELRIHLICQSNAARIARYMMKYGGGSLDDAEAGHASPPAGIRVEKLLMIGTANGGSTNGFANMHQGRSYVPVIGREFTPEVAFSFEAAFETLPAYREAMFFDEDGRALDVDLFDADNWERFGWSVYGRRAAKRLVKRDREDLFGTPRQRRLHLERNLERARRFHALLMRDVPDFPETRYYMVQNGYRETRDRMMLMQDNGGEWKTIFLGHRRVHKPQYFSLASTPGDGHASVLSQQWLSPQELEALTAEPLHVPAYHRTIINHSTTHRAILNYLLDP